MQNVDNHFNFIDQNKKCLFDKMIKLEEKELSLIQQNKFKICLSPFCFNSKNRIFPSQDLQNTGIYIHNKQQCLKWVISLFEFFQPIVPYKIKEFTNIELNFNDQPIQALRKIARLQKSDWKKQISKEISIIKKDINSTLELMEENVLKKLQQTLSKKRFLQEVNGLVEKFITKSSSIKKSGNKYAEIINFDNNFTQQDTQLLTQELNKYFFTNGEAITQLKSAQFLKKFELKQELAEIKKNIQDLQKKILEQKNTIKAHTEERVQFYEWMFQKQDNMFNKLQIVGGLLNVRPQNFHIQGEVIKINCMLCPKYVIEKVSPSHQKQLKKFMGQQLLIHMYNQHHDRIFYSYLKKVSKSECKQIKISQVLQKLQKIDQLHLVDRQTGVSYTQDYISSQIQSIDILQKKNFHLAKNNYILIESKQAINSFVSILASECAHQKKKLIVVSNRFDHLDEISQIFEFTNIEITKKYDGIQMIKFQQNKNSNGAKLDPSIVKKSNAL